jgi:cell division protein FtsL
MLRPASASDRGWRNSDVYREVDNRHALWVFRVVVGVAIALVPLAVYLLQTMSYVETSYAIESLRASEARLMDAERRLTIEKATMESLPAVERRAGTELKLEHPVASRVIVVSPTELGRPSPSERTTIRPPSR